MVEKVRQSVEDSAAQVGYTDLDQFMEDYMAPGSTFESYLEFSRLNAIFNAYANGLMEQVEVTDAEIEAYWAENEQTLTDGGLQKIDKNVVDVRHILVKPEETTAEDGTTSISDEAWAAAEAKANKIYEQWVADGATEEDFIELVGAHSEDPGSAENGGLYEDVYPGQMVEAFDAWCYDDGREVGDHGVVKTDYGYHIMYFAYTQPQWQYYAATYFQSEYTSDKIEEGRTKWPMEVTYKNIVLAELEIA